MLKEFRALLGLACFILVVSGIFVAKKNFDTNVIIQEKEEAPYLISSS